MQSTFNQRISERFTNGPEYLAEWRRDKNLRAEFDGDFETFCHYRRAVEKGLVRSHGGRR